MKDIIDKYFEENKIENFMDYGSDRDSYSMPSLS